MANLVLLILLGVTNVSLSMKCFTCNRAAHPRDCPYVAECGPHEICYVEKLITKDGHIFFNTGCKAKQFCYAIGKRSLTEERINKRDNLGQEIPVCEECCTTDHCNYGGCREPPLPPRSQRGPICMHCKQQQTDQSCNEVTVCSQDQLCAISTAYDVLYDHVLNSFCAPKAFCSQATIIGRKRQAHNYCLLCCGDDMCNANCSLAGTSTTAATPSPNSTTTTATTTTSTPSTTTTTATTPTTTTTTPTTTTTTPTTTTTTPTTTTTTPTTSTTTPTTTTPTTTTTTPTTTTTTPTTTTTTPTTTPQPKCQRTEVRYGKSCYYFSKDFKYWTQALAICQHKGGSLVKIESQSENDFLESQLRQLKANGEIPHTIWGYYIGAHVDNTNNFWKWSDGTLLSYTNWSHGEPDHGTSQPYAMFILPGHYQGDYGWASNDDIDGAERFICERPLV